MKDKINEELLKEVRKLKQENSSLRKSYQKEIADFEQAENTLRLHAIMMENVTEGVYLIGLDDLIIKWTNEKFETMFGYKHKEIVGKHVDIVNAPTEHTSAEIRKTIVDILKEDGEWHGEVKNIKRDGTHFWCYANASLYDHPEYGRVIMSFHTNITEQKKAEQELFLLKEKYRIVADNNYDWEYWIGENGEYNYVSPSVEKVTGYKPNQFYKDNGLLEKIIHPDDKEFSKKHEHSIINECEMEIIEFRIITQEKRVRWVGHVCQKVFGTDGEYLGIRGSNRDITGRKDVDLRLKESEEKYRNIIGNMIDGFYKSDVNGKTTLISPSISRILGFSEKEIIGEPISSFYARPDEREVFLKEIKKHGKVENYEVELIRKGKPNMFTEINGQLIYKNGKYDGVEGVLRDVTERREAETEIIKQNKKLEQQSLFINALLDNLKVGVVACNASGNLTYFNKTTRKFHGLPQEEIGSKDWAEYYDLYLGDGKTKMQTKDIPLFKALEEEQFNDIEMMIKPKQGKSYTLAASGSPIFDGNGKKQGAVVSMYVSLRRTTSCQI